MAGEDSAAGAKRVGGLFRSLRNLGATFIEIVQTRLALLASELQEERLRLVRLGLFAIAAVFFLALGVILLTLLVVLYFGDDNRMLVLAALTAIYLAAGIAFGLAALRRAAERSRLFEASLRELAKDREWLSS